MWDNHLSWSNQMIMKTKPKKNYMTTLELHIALIFNLKFEAISWVCDFLIIHHPAAGLTLTEMSRILKTAWDSHFNITLGRMPLLFWLKVN